MAESQRQDPAKFARYRSRLRNAGLKQVRVWVPDASRPDIRERLAAEIARINGEPADSWLDAVGGELEAMIAGEEARRER